MCRALKVLCVAEDADALGELKRATVSATWELAPGATTDGEALRQLHAERPHVLVVFGAFPGLVERALEAYPFLRVVTDRPVAEGVPGAVVVRSSAQVRDAVTRAGPGDPVGN